MGIGEVNGKILRGGWSAATKPCDACKSAAALVFRRADSAFLCAACDEGGAHRGGGEHERVWMCEVCEQAPAAVTCKADAAALCATCDRDIHSANPLARRHDRLPVVPFFEPAASLLKPSADADADAAVASFLVPEGADEQAPNHNKALDEAEAASWILPNPGGNPNHKLADAAPDHGLKSGEFLFHDTDPFLDFDYAPPVDARFSDSLVPVQNRPLAPQILGHRSSENCFDLDFARSKLSPYTYPAQSLSQSVSSEVCVVPGGNSMSDVSYPLGKQLGGGELNSSAASHATQLSGSEREARVLRYREKRKNRKFEKTIRYASRKAYAETRPRIKGRFAKRAEIDADVVDACFYGGTANAAATAFEFSDSGYGVVPSY